MTVPHGERVRENATIEWAVGTIFAELAAEVMLT